MNKFQLVSIEKFRKFHQFYKCLARWKSGGRDLQSPQVNPPPCPPTSPSPLLLLLLLPPPFLYIRILAPGGPWPAGTLKTKEPPPETRKRARNGETD